MFPYFVGMLSYFLFLTMSKVVSILPVCFCVEGQVAYDDLWGFPEKEAVFFLINYKMPMEFKMTE